METLAALNIVLKESMEPSLKEIKRALHECQAKCEYLQEQLQLSKDLHRQTKLKLSKTREKAVWFEIAHNLARTKWS